MKRLVLSLVLLGLAQGPAHADGSFYGYEGLSVTRFEGELSRLRGIDMAMQLQFGIGYQFESNWAVEVMGRGGGVLAATSSTADTRYGEGSGYYEPAYQDEAGLLGWGISARRFHVVSKYVQLYGRAGLTENFLMSSGQTLAGFGISYGMGAQLTARVRALGLLFWPLYFAGIGPKVNVSLWGDVGGEMGNLHAGHSPGDASYDYRSSSIAFGLSVGGDF